MEEKVDFLISLFIPWKPVKTKLERPILYRNGGKGKPFKEDVKLRYMYLVKLI